MKKQKSPFTLFQRIIQQDTGIHDPGAKRMILSVLSASLATVVLLVILEINPEVMMLYGVLLVVALLFAQRGYLVPARLAIPLGGLIVFTYLMIHNKGIRDVALIGLPAVIIVAGLLFGKFGTLLYGILSVGVVIFLGVEESNGIIVNQFSATNSSTDYAAASIAMGIVAIMQWLVIDRLNENIS